MKVREKILQAGNKIASACSGVVAAMYVNTANALCSGVFDQQIDASTIINAGSNPDQLFSKLLGIVVGIFIVVGVFMLLGGIFKYLEAKGEDNTAGEGKAIKNIVTGAAMIGIPTIIQLIA